MVEWQKTAGLLALLFALALSVMVAQQLADKVANFSFARSDSDAWNFAQVEVAYDRFQIALQDGLIDADEDGRLPRDHRLEISTAFDIFYSRVGTVADRYTMFPDQPAIRQTLGEVTQARDTLAAMIDADRYETARQVRRMLEVTDGLRQDIRDFALAAMLAAIADQESERTEVYSSLQASTRILTGLVFFLLALGIGLVYLWRTLAAKNVSERNLVSYLSKLLEVSSDGIVVVDENLCITDVNRTAERTFGFERDALIGCHAIRKLGPQRRHSRVEAQLRGVLDGKLDPENHMRRMPIVARRKDGSVFPAALSVVATRDQTHKMVLVGFIRDLSAERQSRRITRRALAQARNDAAAKQRFLATMSHEMRTPLHSIVVASDMAQHAATLKGATEHLPTIRAAAQTALNQVEDVLEIATDGGKSVPRLAEDFDARAVARSVFLQMKPLAAARGNKLVFDWAGPVHLRGSPQNLFKIVYNLVSNAIKATRDGTVTISAGHDVLAGQSALRVDVADTGRGISAAEQGRIFDDFVSGFKTSENSGTGTGLGLGIVKRALAAMGGRIALQSEVGQGAIFRATLPLSTDGVAPSPVLVPEPEDVAHSDCTLAPPLAPIATTGNKVLVIEDHATNRRLLEQMLVTSGYRVTTAVDGLDGLRKAVTEDFALVLTDLNMPELTGEKVARCLRNSRMSGTACIIAVTAKATIPIEQRASIIEGGIDAFLFKPFDRARLDDVIHDALEEGNFDAPMPSHTPDLDIAPDLLAQAGKDMQDVLSLMPKALQPDAGNAGLDELARFAHYVAGSLLFTGHQWLGNALLDLERMCQDRDVECVQGMTVVLEAETARFLSEITPDLTSA